MKLIVRADDVGYTKTHNDGTFKTLDEGITTSCDLMLDCPGLEDACERLRNYPWISIGWHTHFWGRPALDPSEVPSMVNEEGRFKWRKDKKLVMEVNYEEALKECEAQSKEVTSSEKNMKELAESFLQRHKSVRKDYTEKFREKEELCPQCGGVLVKRSGKYGEFYGCSNFPQCRYTRKLENE